MRTEDAVIYLCTCSINGIVPEKGKIEGMNLQEVYQFASFHMLSAMVAMALESAGFKDRNSIAALTNSLKNNSLFDLNRKAIVDRLEQKGIWYMPLKGAVLKDFYPKYGMREMSDNDILIDPGRSSEVKCVMEELGFEALSFGIGNHDVYYKEPSLGFEMHKELFEGLFFDRFSSYYQNVKDRLVKDEGNRFGYHFSPEDLYVYLIAHEYKHYSGGGTGLRSLLDTYVCLKALSLDTAYIGQEAEKLGIRDFEERNRLLALHVFGESGPSAEEQELLEEICSSGAHGTVAHRVEKQIKEKGRWRYFLSRLTLPREEMRRHYPILKKAPVLYPVFWGYRLIHGFFYKRDRFLYQLKTVLKKDHKSE